MLGLFLALSISARAVQVEVKTPVPPAAMPMRLSKPHILDSPGLPSVPQLPVPAQQVQLPAEAPAAAPVAAPKAGESLQALGAQLAQARSDPGARTPSFASRLSGFFDHLDGYGPHADPDAPAPEEPDYFPRLRPGLPRPVRRDPPPPPPPPIKNAFLRRLAMAAPAIFVLSNAFVGVQAVWFASRGWVLEAGTMILFAGIFTDLAARTARHFRVPADIEARIDSIASMVSFAAAPAFILYKAALQPLPWVGLAVSVFFAGAGIFRLVHERPDNRGLTVHAAAGALVAMTLASGVLPPVAVAVMAAATALLGAAMISRKAFPRYRKVSVALVLIFGTLYASFHAPLAHPESWALAPALGFGVYFANALLRRRRQAHK